jgi:hypothetical protein
MTTIYFITNILVTVSGIFTIALYLQRRESKRILESAYETYFTTFASGFNRKGIVKIAQIGYLKATKQFFISLTLLVCFAVILILLILTSASWSKLN